jgi:hypothetical protein
MKWRDSTRFGDLAHKARLKYMCVVVCDVDDYDLSVGWSCAPRVDGVDQCPELWLGLRTGWEI